MTQPSSGAAAPARAADEQDAGRDDEDTGELAAGRVGADDHDGKHERRDRRKTTRDRIHERELEPAVRGGQQRHVSELERSRRDDVFPRLAVDVPREQPRTAQARART